MINVSQIRSNKILLIDHDMDTQYALHAMLTQCGYQVHCASHGEEGLRKLNIFNPDLVILDITVPGLGRWEACKRIQQTNTPFMVLTTLSDEEDVVQGLDIGAIDYVTKPYSDNILLARIRAALRLKALTQQAAKTSSSTYDDGYLSIDLNRRRVIADGRPVKLTATEYNLLMYLVQHAGRVCTAQQILGSVWGREYQDAVEYVYIYVGHLRRKLEREPKRPQYIITEQGIGYRFEKARVSQPVLAA